MEIKNQKSRSQELIEKKVERIENEKTNKQVTSSKLDNKVRFRNHTVLATNKRNKKTKKNFELRIINILFDSFGGILPLMIGLIISFIVLNQILDETSNENIIINTTTLSTLTSSFQSVINLGLVVLVSIILIGILYIILRLGTEYSK